MYKITNKCTSLWRPPTDLVEQVLPVHTVAVSESTRARECACVRYLPVIYRPPPGHEGHKVVGFPTSRKVRHASYLILMRSRVQFHRRPLPLTFALFVNSAKRMEFLHESLVVSESKQVSHLQKCGGTWFRDT